jgi:hypothetical protein
LLDQPFFQALDGIVATALHAIDPDLHSLRKLCGVVEEVCALHVEHHTLTQLCKLGRCPARTRGGTG